MAMDWNKELLVNALAAYTGRLGQQHFPIQVPVQQVAFLDQQFLYQPADSSKTLLPTLLKTLNCHFLYLLAACLEKT